MTTTRNNRGKLGARLASVFLLAALPGLPVNVSATDSAPPKRIYIANDDHTDYLWSMDEEGYRRAFLEMLDYYLDQADATAGHVAAHQGRWNCDGSLYLWTYERHRSKREVARLIERIRDGHISVPLNTVVSTYGAQPAEAVLRGMYYAGGLERRHGLRLPLAVAMENQTLPYGLGALFAGAGAKYSWRGICACATKLPTAGDREHEIYWWRGADGSRILLKWNSLLGTPRNRSMGGYAEAWAPEDVVELVDRDAEFQRRYPYRVIGAFGKGWDLPKILTDEFVRAARAKSTPQRQVIVSNEVDFFTDFETTHGASLPTVAASFGNEWDLLSASMSEVSAQVRRAVEKLRAAEAMAAVVSLPQPEFMRRHAAASAQAWINLGLYWEHNWTADGPIISRAERAAWQRRIAGEIASYVESLHADAARTLGTLIRRTGDHARFFVFNPLSWSRTDYADFPLDAAQPPRSKADFRGLREPLKVPAPVTVPLHVIELGTGRETPSQIVTLPDGKRRIRILAADIPSLGYKVFEVQSGQGAEYPPAAKVSDNVIETNVYKITVAPRGAITSLIDKARGQRELVREIQGRALNDLGPGSGELEVENAGPVSVTLRARTTSPLQHISRITVFRGSPRIELHNEIEQNFADVRSWGFGFALERPDIWHEEVGAVIRAKLLGDDGHYAERNARYDWLTLNHYADIGGADGFGATLSNADLAFFQAGNSTITALDTMTPSIAVLAGGQVDGAKLGIPAQGGDTRFTQRFALQTRPAWNPADAMRFALEHQNPLQTGMVTGGSTFPEKTYSLLNVSQSDVFAWAVKPAEEGGGHSLVVRLWNQAHAPREVRIEFSTPPSGVVRTTHLETEVAAARLEGATLPAALQPQQLQTYRLSFGSP